MQGVHREIQGLETFQKNVNCESVNYETMNCEDPLYRKNSHELFETKIWRQNQLEQKTSF